MPILKRLKIDDFLSYQQLDLGPGGLNILLGRSGSGKSNLLKFFHLLARSAEKQLFSEMLRLGGVRQVRHKNRLKQAAMPQGPAWHLEFDSLGAQDDVHYDVRLQSADEKVNFVVDQEVVSRPPYETYVDRFEYLGRYRTRIRHLRALRDTQTENEADVDEGELAIAQIIDKARYPIMHELRETLSQWTIYRGLGPEMLENLHNSQMLSVVEPLRLKVDGSNFHSVLYALLNDGDYSAEQDLLHDILSQAFPDFKSLALPPAAAGRIQLEWQTRYGQFPSAAISDGMLRFLFLTTMLILPKLPPLLAIDEIELGLHPDLIRLLGGLLKEAAQRTQLFITTHNPLLLNAREIDLLSDVMLVDSQDGTTTIRRVEDSDDLRHWLEEFSPGEVWAMGKLGV
jgi:predicted ATPase